MRVRETPLPIPPERAPYFRATLGNATMYFRTPSLLVLANAGKAMGQEQLRALLLVSTAVQGGSSLLDALAVARSGMGDALALIGAVVGLAWADPVLELETPRPDRWTAETLVAFGSAAFEELHEQGWTLGQTVTAALAVVEQVSEITAFEQGVQEKIRFFLRPRATPSGESSRPSATSSTVASEPSDVAS